MFPKKLMYHILYIPAKVHMTPEERKWVDNIGGRLFDLSRIQEKNLKIAINQIFETPNLITALNVSKSDQLNCIKNIIEDRESMATEFKEIVNNHLKQMSGTVVEARHQKHIFGKPRVKKRMPKFKIIKITKQNVDQFCEISEPLYKIPPSNEMFDQFLSKFYCKFQNCNKSFSDRRVARRHALTVHYHPRKYKCKICKQSLSRKAIFTQHCLAHLYFKKNIW